jgi:hypothetical protein
VPPGDVRPCPQNRPATSVRALVTARHGASRRPSAHSAPAVTARLRTRHRHHHRRPRRPSAPPGAARPAPARLRTRHRHHHRPSVPPVRAAWRRRPRRPVPPSASLNATRLMLPSVELRRAPACAEPCPAASTGGTLKSLTSWREGASSGGLVTSS